MFAYWLYLSEIHCWLNVLVPVSSGIYQETKSCRKDHAYKYYAARHRRNPAALKAKMFALKRKKKKSKSIIYLVKLFTSQVW